MQKKICVVYAEGAVTDPTCQKLFASFVLEISSWMMLHSGVPVEVDSDKIKALIETNPHSTTREPTYSKYANQSYWGGVWRNSH